MKYLEENKMFHGNLNPSNILLDNNCHPILNNISCNCTINEINDQSNSYIQYYAPEILNGGNISIKSDVYSFGKIIIILFSNDDKDLMQIPDNMPEFLVKIVEECSRKDPQDRLSFRDIYDQLVQSLISKENIQKYKNELDAQIECPITFYRIPKVIFKPPDNLNQSEINDEKKEININQLFSNKNLRQLLLNVPYDKTIKIIMVCGHYQYGKSTFLRTITGNGAFFSGKGIKSTTFGLLMDGPYSENDIKNRITKKSFKNPLTREQYKLKKDSVIFFIDSQGLGDEKFLQEKFSDPVKTFISFFCTIADICINITKMTELANSFDEILSTIRRGQTMKISDGNNDFNEKMTKLLFFVRSYPELKDPLSTKNEFKSIQKKFEKKWYSEHKIASEKYYIELIKPFPLGDPQHSLSTYNYSVWNSIPYIFKFLNNSADHTIDYVQSKIEFGVDFLFDGRYNDFLEIKCTVEEQIIAIVSISMKYINGFIKEFNDAKVKDKENVIDSIKNFLIGVKTIMAPFTIGQHSEVSLPDYIQYSYDVIKNLTAYLVKNIPELKEILHENVIELFKKEIFKIVGDGLISASGGTVMTTVAINITKKVLVEAAKKLVPLAIPGGQIIGIVSAISSTITFGSIIFNFLKVVKRNKDEIRAITENQVKMSNLLLWKIVDDKKNLVNKMTSLKVDSIISTIKGKETIIALENNNSNFLKFIIQSMTGVKCDYENAPLKNKEQILYGPFNINDIMYRISRYYPIFKSKIQKDIYILYLRKYNEKDLRNIERIQTRAMFFLTCMDSVDSYPTIQSKPIYRFFFVQNKKINLLRKQDCIELQNNPPRNLEKKGYNVIPIPIIMTGHDNFKDIGPQTNKSLRWAFHQMLKMKYNQVEIDF